MAYRTGHGSPDADLAVVGGGVIGCMVAREVLRRAPATSVVLLERDGTGAGASRRSAGLHFPRGGTDRVRRMARLSQAYYERLLRAWPRAPIYPTSMSVVADPAREAQLRQVYLERAKLVRTDAVAMDAIGVPAGDAVWSVDGGHYADVYALTQLVAARLRPQVTVLEGVRVQSVRPAGGAVELRLGTAETLTARRVVLAPGPWTADAAWRSLVAPLGVRIKKIVALHISHPPAGQDQAIVFHDEDAFLLWLGYRGHWLFSYTCQQWDVDPDQLAGGLSATELTEAREVLARYAPSLAERCRTGRVFCDAYSGTGEPLVRALDPDGRIVFAGAANGSGYRLAPAIAAEAADLLITESRSHL